MAAEPSKGLKRIFRVANRVHVMLYRRSGGRFANRVAGMPVMLITTFGRKSGNPTTNAVVYIHEDQDYLVSATNGGSDWMPGWFLNLKARPEAIIEVGGAKYSVQAKIAKDAERAGLYEKFKAASENFVKYERSTQRVLPVIRLTPAISTTNVAE